MELLVKDCSYVLADEYMAREKIKDSLICAIDATSRMFVDIAVLCIGSDRSTGDSLGPLVGYLLEKKQLMPTAKIYGSLRAPVHARNIEEAISKIYSENKNPLIIAVDAAISKVPESVGLINTGLGNLRPGAYAGKQLPPIGDIFITGVVNWSQKLNDFETLQSTRLGIVMNMADKIAGGLDMALNVYSHLR